MIYFAQSGSGNAIKIGLSDNLPMRFKELSAYAGRFQLLGLMPGTRADEQALHRRFRAWRTKKYSPRREWYDDNAELRDYIQFNASTDLSQYRLPDAVIRHVTQRYIERPAN